MAFGSQERLKGDSEGKMGPTQSGDDRGGSVAQERRRCQDGWRASKKGEAVMMDKDFMEKLEMEDGVPVPKRVYITREDLEVFGFTAFCSGCTRGRRDKRTQKIAEGVVKRS